MVALAENWTRRRVIQSGLMAGAAFTSRNLSALVRGSVFLIVDPHDAVVNTPEVRWATSSLHDALHAGGFKVSRRVSLHDVPAGELCIVAAASSHPAVKAVLQHAGAVVASAAESLAVVRTQLDGRTVVAATGNDARGTMYALLELADRVRYSDNASVALIQGRDVIEQPANQIRSMLRMFASDVEDQGWYHDRAMWPEYFTNLARQRFNRFNLALGMGYDFIKQVTDAYFLFPYPFLLKVPGYDVRASNVSDAERDANLESLKYMAQQAVAHGLEFHVGLWTHGYIWEDSPNAHQVIEGVTPQNHAPYCRDAVRMLLQQVPEISGLTFRVHGESGVTEGSYDFWKTVFQGVSSCGRTISLDMHTKGMDETMEKVGLDTGLPVQLSPKYWAEHMGLPYQQTDIRVMEQPKADADKMTGLMKFSAGTRSFLRYGYGDLLTENRPWKVVYRIWPGTQRLLLWSDPDAAAAHSRAFSFCGSNGVEVMEMLSFKGRRGSGVAGNRTAYADASLVPRWDWQKYLYTTAVWGRSLYNPDTDREVFLRIMRYDVGAAALDAQASLAHASRVLPTVTTAYAPSAGNNTYWPEMYWNESFVDAKLAGPYTDSPKPIVFSNASTLDPVIFSRMAECASELLCGEKSGRYSHLDVALWLDQQTSAAESAWKAAEMRATNKHSAPYRRLAIDIAMQVQLGRFFAARFRSGVLYAVYQQSQDARALTKSVELYKQSRNLWAKLAQMATPVYVSNVSVGEHPYQQGHWADRLPAMDNDIALAEAQLAQAKPGTSPAVTAAISAATAAVPRRATSVVHAPARAFVKGTSLEIEAMSPGVSAMQLHYRHVNQAERFQTVVMDTSGGTFHAVIPAAYTATEYPLQYFFQVRNASGDVSLYPGLGDSYCQQPYYVVRLNGT